MLVKFYATWFAPGEDWEGWAPNLVDKVRTMSGQRFRKGVRDVPEELRSVLPKSAVIIDVAAPLPVHPVVAEPNYLHEADLDRAAADAFEVKLQAAETERKRIVSERMAKARAAKQAKAA